MSRMQRSAIAGGQRFLLAALAILTVFIASGAYAHTQSYGFLSVAIGNSSADGRLEIAVRDIDAAYDLDADRDGKIIWGEVRTRETSLAAALLDGISVGIEGESCSLSAEPTLTGSRGGETYLVIPFRGVCPPSSGSAEIGYDLFFNIDAQHRGLVAVTSDGVTQSFVAAPDATSASLDFQADSNLDLFFTFVTHGAHHIWIGYDHILFLLTLLLGTVLTRRAGAWVPVDTFGSALTSAVKVVTAFTASHSLTLALAAFGVLRIPVALTESVIAATIALAAINNVVPIVTRKLWLVALVFGLIHGVGFANVLAELELPRQGLLTALLAFNIGVELGQLAIVVAVLPLLMLAGRQAAYGRIMPVVSLAIAAIGVAWFVQRALGIAILPIG